LLILGGVGFANDDAARFVGMVPFTEYVIEALSNPRDIMSDFVLRSPDEVDAGGVAYRIFIAEGYAPPALHMDVCPAPYETTWYSLVSTAGHPIAFSFVMEVEEMNRGLATWFSPVTTRMLRNVQSPAYLAFCNFGATMGAYRLSHSLVVDHSSVGSGGLACDVRVVVGEEVVLVDAQAAPVSVECYGER
jgi:hypothetical protein